mgnify:CR=1 FL=1
MIKKTKKIEPINEPEKVIEPIVVVEPEQESVAKANFRLLIENYKKVSPKKYEMKKAELEAKLNKIK